MKDRIIGLGKIIDDEGTVQLLDADMDQSVVDDIQKAIDKGNIEVSAEQFTIDAVKKLIKKHS